MQQRRKKLESLEDYLARYPRQCAHIIAQSSGYATSTKAAQILKNAKESKNFGIMGGSLISLYR